ncbi:MAG: tlde1 domain-containing protein [Pseudomonadota bacterium]
MSQSTGQVTRVDANGNSTVLGTGYSGHGEGVNNPDMQNVEGVGPIPQGRYEIGPQQDNITGEGTRLPGSMRLTPLEGTDTFGRDGFIIHGDNARGDQSASKGCPILNRNIRDQIANSDETVFRVVP